MKTHCKRGHKFSKGSYYAYGSARHCKACMLEWKNSNLEKVRKADQDYRDKNPEKQREKTRLWAKKNPKKARAKKKKREALQKKNGGRHTRQQWLDVKALYDNKCLSCNRNEQELFALGLKLIPDHVLPLVKGGTDDIENIQPLCQACNDKKYTKYIDYRTSFRRNTGEHT